VYHTKAWQIREHIYSANLEVLTTNNVPASACCFFTASSCSGEPSGGLYETGALEMVPGAAPFGSRRLAYSDKPPRAGVEALLAIVMHALFSSSW
jgi:hypothetical protein